MTPLAVLLVALVSEDATSLRSAPSDSAPAQATLFRGDWLEVRGEVPGFLKVWDHRHERPGYVRAARVRLHRAEEASADELRAVVRFLREAHGFESLGIGYVALYLRVANPARRGQAEWGEVLGALGAMAERLASRAGGAAAGGARERDAVLAGQLGVIESYGVRLRRFESEGPSGTSRLRTVVCYDGDAFARVMALAAAGAEERARSALSLTRRACFDPATTAAHRKAWNEARLTVLGEAAAGPGMARLPRPLGHRLRLRTAEALVERAHGQASTDLGTATAAASEALRLLALVDRGELAPEDLPVYDEVAVRVATVRWLTEAPAARPPRSRAPAVQLVPGRPGETCVRLLPGDRSAGAVLAERCTFGTLFPASLRHSAAGNVVAIAVAPVPSWTELWLFSTAGSDWRVEVLPPGAGRPGEDIGYVELAGFSPDGQRVLVVREFHIDGRAGKRFELRAADGAVLGWASAPGRLRAFSRWAATDWRRGTLALR